MRLGWIAFATLILVGGMAVEAAAETWGAEGLTGEAAASCVIDPVTEQCLPSCPMPDPARPTSWTCRL